MEKDIDQARIRVTCKKCVIVGLDAGVALTCPCCGGETTIEISKEVLRKIKASL